MEDSSEMHDEENRVSVEKGAKRILKTPAQIMALEKFYTEHNYPSEEMKSELAEEIGLTEKQISSWFCHRRLKDKKVPIPKDEACANNGRQDRSSGIMQDRGSGLRQDSCGSTKQSDYRKVDPKEVESRRLYGHNSSGADLTYDRTSQFTGNVNDGDDTSSESSSSLQDKLCNQHEDLYDMKGSGLIANGAVRPSIPKSGNKYKPSGYLKVKGEIENAAITAVKRQLGKHYLEDGPPLGVEFQTLPPGAFSSLTKDPLNGAFYVGDLARMHSPDFSGGRKRPNIGNRYESYNSTIGSEDSYMKEANGIVSEARDKKPHHHLKRKPSYNNSNSNPGGTSSMDYYDDLVGETSTHSSKRNYKMNSNKHGIEGIRPDASNHHHHLPGDVKTTNEMADPWLQDHDNGSPKTGPRNDYLSKSSNLIPGPGKSLDLEARGLSTSWEEEARLYGDMKEIKGYQDPVRVRKHLKNEMKVPKRFKDEVAQQEYVTKAPVPKWHQTTNFYKGSVMERPSSFSEDETAETSSPME